MPKLLEDTTEIKTILSEFYDALNTLFKGDAAPMLAVWSHSDDVSYLGPQGGVLVGWEKVLKAWKDQAAIKLGGNIAPEDVHITRIDNIGIVQNYEVGSNLPNGKHQKVRIRATNIFRKENGKWKMITHHTDLLSFLK